MKWSRTAFGRDWHDGLAHPAHGGAYRNGSAPVRSSQRQDWNSCCTATSLLEQSQQHVHHPSPQETYICCAYSPRCFIIQKVKPTSGQNTSELPDQDDSTSVKILDCIQDGQFDELQTSVLGGDDSTADGDRDSETHLVFPAMEDTGIVASLPSEASNSTASSSSSTSTMPMSSSATATVVSEPQTFLPPPSLPHNQVDIYSNHSPGHLEAEAAGERTPMPMPELKSMIRQQLEYYFSRENLATDSYLRSQMDGDQYVPITTIAKFNQIRRLTEDLSLVVEVLRESPSVQVDEAGEKVRPSQRSIVVILREIPESTPMKDLEELFSGENCPMFSRCEFAHNDTWYVLFDSDDDARKAFQYLREGTKTFKGRPIMARMKVSLTYGPYTHPSYYKNGVSSPPTTEAYTPQHIPQQPQPAQPQPPAQQQTHVQYAYANVSNETYNNQQICPPFYPPTMLQAWAPTTATCVDLGAVFSMNGLSPQAAYRPINNTNKSNYASRERPVKSYNPQQSYNINRNDQSNRYFGRSAHVSRQQQQPQQQPPFHNLISATSSCSYDYGPYASSLRNFQQHLGLEINNLTAQNLCYRRLQSHASFTSQSRHAPVLLPTRNHIGVGAINMQDQSYIPVASSMIPFHKDAVTGASIAGVSKQNADMQNKDSWNSNQKQRNKKWSRENGSNSSNKPFSETTNGYFNKPVNGAEPKPESPKFDLQTASFPPLPGCLDTDILEVDVYESTRLSDIVKGTAKISIRDNKTQISESALNANALMKESSTNEEAAVPSDGAFMPAATSPLVSESIVSVDGSKEKSSEWIDESCASDNSKEEPLLNSNSINSMTQTPSSSTAFSLGSNSVSPNISPASASVNSPMTSTVGGSSTPAPPTTEQEVSANVPSEVMEKQSLSKMPKSKQPDAVAATSKSKSCDLPSPKSKAPESMGKMKTDNIATNKEKMPQAPKPPRANSFPINSTNKLPESSSNKDKTDSVSSSSMDSGVSKNSDSFSLKDKPLHPTKGRSSFDLPKSKGPEPIESAVTLLSVNGHMDSESVSSEDEKPSRKLTYSEVAIRAKEKVEKLAQELKEKERQEAMVRHHRQQEIVAQGKQGTIRGPFREFTRRVSDRSGTRDWRDRRKPARTVSLPSPGQ